VHAETSERGEEDEQPARRRPGRPKKTETAAPAPALAEESLSAGDDALGVEASASGDEQSALKEEEQPAAAGGGNRPASMNRGPAKRRKRRGIIPKELKANPSKGRKTAGSVGARLSFHIW